MLSSDFIELFFFQENSQNSIVNTDFFWALSNYIGREMLHPQRCNGYLSLFQNSYNLAMTNTKEIPQEIITKSLRSTNNQINDLKAAFFNEKNMKHTEPTSEYRTIKAQRAQINISRAIKST